MLTETQLTGVWRLTLVSTVTPEHHLRTPTVDGTPVEPPECGKRFHLIGDSLASSEVDSRHVITSPVMHLHIDSAFGYRFRTRNSEYTLTKVY